MISEIEEELKSELKELGKEIKGVNILEDTYNNFFESVLINKQYNNIFILSDLQTYEKHTELFEKIQSVTDNITMKLMPNDITPTIYNAENIMLTEKFDAIIIVGCGSVLEIGKYIASVLDVKYYIILTDYFLSYNITSFNFMYDEISYDFYKSNCAELIVLDKDLINFNAENINKMISIYLTNKVSLFENKFLKLYSGYDADKPMLEYLSKQYAMIDAIIYSKLNAESIIKFVKMFIKISLIMENEKSTKLFFLSPFFLACTYLRLTDYTESYLCDLNGQFSTECLKLFLKNVKDFESKPVNLTAVASDMKKMFNLNFVSIFKFLKPVPEISKLKSEEYKLKYTREQCIQSLNKLIAEIEKVSNSIEYKNKYDSTVIDNCFSYSSEFYAKPCMLGFFRNHGML